MPSWHDGQNTIIFRLWFSDVVASSCTKLRDKALSATGGNATKARRVNGSNNLWGGPRRTFRDRGRERNARQRGDLQRLRRQLHIRCAGAVLPVDQHRIQAGQLTPAHRTPQTHHRAGNQGTGAPLPLWDCVPQLGQSQQTPCPTCDQRFAVEIEMSENRVVSYTRVYSDSKQSVMAQLERIRRAADEQGLTIVREYEDEGDAGATDCRPGFQRRSPTPCRTKGP